MHSVADVFSLIDGAAAPRPPGAVPLADETLDRKRGSSIKAGTALLRSGAEIGPGEIALLASLGESRPLVHPAPRVRHLITGREIVSPDARPEPGRIRDSNGPMIRALLPALRGVDALIHFPESTRGAAGDRVSVVPCSRFGCTKTGSTCVAIVVYRSSSHSTAPSR